MNKRTPSQLSARAEQRKRQSFDLWVNCPAELSSSLLRIWSGWHSIDLLWRKHA